MWHYIIQELRVCCVTGALLSGRVNMKEFRRMMEMLKIEMTDEEVVVGSIH